MPINFYLVDAFHLGPFTGNPAGVCFPDDSYGDDWMQSVAREANQAETAFLEKELDHWNLRWFTPATEVDLCGHATLASAHVLWETGRLADDADANFETKSGRLTCRPAPHGKIEMDFPAVPVLSREHVPDIESALGIRMVDCGKNAFDYLLVLESAQALRDYKPDFAKIKQIPVRGVCMTAPSDSGYDFESRFFAPQSGVDEDHATGSAHCMLAPYWASQLGKGTLRAFQASPRGAEIECEVAGDRVLLRGAAITTIAGDLRC